MKTKISARKFLSKYMIYLAFVALLIVFSLTLRNVGNGFLDMGNVWNIIRQTALIAILGVGMTYALGAGQIDLSVGSVVGLTSLVTAWTVQAAGLIPGVLAGLAVGAVVGALNGALIAWVKIPPFIATLGTQILFAGVSRTVSGLKSVPITNMTFNFVFGGGDFGGVPVLLLWMVVIVVVGQLFLRKRPFGRQVISVGGNPKAFSPPDSSVMVLSCLPGGCTRISMPHVSGCERSSSSSEALPPPNISVNVWPK